MRITDLVNGGANSPIFLDSPRTVRFLSECTIDFNYHTFT